MKRPATRTVHRLLGVLLLLPLAGWCVTGMLFHLKPGWTGAYDMATLRFEPLGEVSPIQPRPDWIETKRLRTVLGEHLLVRTAESPLHLDPATGLERPHPTEAEVRLLLAAALADNPRYGAVSAVDGLDAETETGVRLSLDWERLRLSQRGSDTDLIDALYRVHYLQWTGIAWLDRGLAAAGLLALTLLSLLGLRLALRSGHD